MARLFQTEKSRMKNSGQQPARQKDEAEFLRVSLTAKKQSLLPIGNLHIILCIFNGNMIFKHIFFFFVFQSLLKKTMMMMKKKMTKKMKIMKKNEDEDEYKESTPSEVF